MQNENKAEKDRIDRCRYCFPHFNLENRSFEFHCVHDGWEDNNVKTVTKEQCNSCPYFDSRYIEYPLTINGIENAEIKTNNSGREIGYLCAVRPCTEDCDEKTYLGVYLGDLPIMILTSFDNKTGILENSTMNNPAMYVPELKRIVYGCESWWHKIESIEEFSEITDKDIDNTWYVAAMKQIYGTEGGNES